MGDPVKIVDLAKDMIMLSGLRFPDDIDIEITGSARARSCMRSCSTRPKWAAARIHEKIFRGTSELAPGVMVINSQIARLEGAATSGQQTALKELRSIVEGYSGPPPGFRPVCKKPLRVAFRYRFDRWFRTLAAIRDRIIWARCSPSREGRLQGILHLRLNIHDSFAVRFDFVLGLSQLLRRKPPGLGVFDQLLQPPLVASHAGYTGIRFLDVATGQCCSVSQPPARVLPLALVEIIRCDVLIRVEVSIQRLELALNRRQLLAEC